MIAIPHAVDHNPDEQESPGLLQRLETLSQRLDLSGQSYRGFASAFRSTLEHPKDRGQI